MANSNNEQSKGLLSSVFGVAKKLSHLANKTSQNAPQTTTPSATSGQIIEGQARQKSPLEIQKYENANQLLRAHLPQVSRQLLGRHYGRVNSFANFVLPSGTDRLADEILNSLTGVASALSSTQWVLAEAGVKKIDELRQDLARSTRVGDALAEQNKIFAVAQGALSGATGWIGSAIDVPASLTLALRLIYQTGRAYGFELDEEKDQDIVEYIFKEVDLSLVAEKQAVLMGLKALRQMIESQDLQQLKQLLGSDNNGAALQEWLSHAQLPANLQWLNGLSKVKLITKLTPIAGAVISAAYSWKLMDDTKLKAQEVFQTTRQYLQAHPEAEQGSLLENYEAALAVLQTATPVLALAEPEVSQNVEAVEQIKQQHAAEVIATHEVISEVKVQKRRDTNDSKNVPVEEEVSEGLAQLAETLVEPSEPVPPQQSALSDAQHEELAAQQAEESEVDENEAELGSSKDEASPSTAATEAKVTEAKTEAKVKAEDAKVAETKTSSKAKRSAKTPKSTSAKSVAKDKDEAVTETKAAQPEVKANTQSASETTQSVSDATQAATETTTKKAPQVSKEQVIRAVTGKTKSEPDFIVPNPIHRD